MVDLNPQKSINSSIGKTGSTIIPSALTFEDIQKMHYTNLNSKGHEDDDFRPQDFLDLDSGDSDNEVLAKFKPEKEERKMLNLAPPSPIKQFVPNYIGATGIEE